MRTPVTVIGGYLGAGKTTLVNHILRTATERIAVIVNDFGEINIDADLIESDSSGVPDGVLALANGCICCSLVDGFASALDSIAQLPVPPDRLVIEASGVSDPAQVAAYCHGPGLSLEAIVVLADTETIRERIDDVYVGQTVAQQLDAAHIIVLTKPDMVEPDVVEATSTWVRSRWPEAILSTARDGDVELEVLFGQHDDLGELDRREQPGRDDTRRVRSLDSDDQHSDHGFHTWYVEPDGPSTRVEIESLMQSLPDEVIRAKGIVWLDEVPERQMVLQRVGKRWTLVRGQPWVDAPRSRIVFIATEAVSQR